MFCYSAFSFAAALDASLQILPKKSVAPFRELTVLKFPYYFQMVSFPSVFLPYVLFVSRLFLFNFIYIC
jgi:hypothetical protein